LSYPKKLYKMMPSKGLVSDLPPYELPAEAWSHVINMHTKNGGMQLARPTDKAYGSLLAVPYHIQNVQAQGQNFWLYWGDDTISAAETSNPHVDLTPGGGLTSVLPQNIISTQLNGLSIFTNGFDAPHWWTGSTSDNFAPLPDWPAATVARGVAAGAYHVFAFDIDGPSGEFPMKVMWSDAAPPGAVPGSWTPAASNQAGDTELAQTPGRVQCMVPLRGSYAFYKTSSMYLADYVEGNNIYAFRIALTQCGAFTRKAVVDIGGRHLVVTDGDIVLNDGVNVQSIADDRVRQFLFGQISQENYELLTVVYHQASSQVWVMFPQSGASLNNLALVWDMVKNTWGTRALSNVRHAATGYVNDTSSSMLWDSVTEEWDAVNTLWNAENFSSATRSLMLADDIRHMVLVGRAGTFNEGYLERLSLSLGEAERFKFVKRIHMRGEGGTVYIRIGTQAVADGAVTWSAEMPLVLGADPFINCSVQGRFISVSVRVPEDSLITYLALEAELRGYV
jgi:hypothetical protein